MNRHGVVSIWALVVLSVATVISMALVGQMAATRKRGERNVRDAQTVLMKDAGLDHARQMVAKDKSYKGETLKLAPVGEVIIAVIDGRIEVRRATSSLQKESHEPRTK